jgi:hypothetical protein
MCVREMLLCNCGLPDIQWRSDTCQAKALVFFPSVHANASKILGENGDQSYVMSKLPVLKISATSTHSG